MEDKYLEQLNTYTNEQLLYEIMYLSFDTGTEFSCKDSEWKVNAARDLLLERIKILEIDGKPFTIPNPNNTLAKGLLHPKTDENYLKEDYPYDN